jgi:cbb3-type cytochrome oxidase subunit 3
MEILLALRPWLLVLMVCLFAAMTFWAYAPGRRARMDECGQIPLRDDDA